MSRNFIIIEPDPVVCMDLEGMLISRYADSHIAAGSSLSDIGAAIHNCGPDTTLFVKAALLNKSDDLIRVVEIAMARGTHVVIIGKKEQPAFRLTFVDVPFTTDMIIAVVDGANAKGTAQA